MKKVTIIIPPEYEGAILDVLGKIRAVHLKEVSGPEFLKLKREDEEIDFRGEYEKFHSRAQQISKYLEEMEFENLQPDYGDFKAFMEDPKGEGERLLGEFDALITQLRDLEQFKEEQLRGLDERLQKEVEEETTAFNEAKNRIEDRYRIAKARLESLKALEPEEFKSCFSVGVARKELIPNLEKFLKRYSDIFYKVVDVTADESFIFVFGSEERRKWVESIFLVFEVRDIFDFIDAGDILLVLDPKKRNEAIEIYQEAVRKLEQKETTENLQKLEEEYRKNINREKDTYENNIKKLDSNYIRTLAEIKSKQEELIKPILSMDYFLKCLSNEKIRALRTKVMTVIQGWIPEENEEKLENGFKQIEAEAGSKFYVEFEEPSKDEAPPSMPKTPLIVRPFYVLTSMIGIPNSREVNPTLIFTLMWGAMFGFMFPDIGQGVLIASLGFVFAYVLKKRLMGINFVKVGKLFILLGLSGAIFGALFGEFFLLEVHPLLFKPLFNIWTMIKVSIYVGIINVAFALILGTVNRFRMGEKVGSLLGERGLGGLVLFVGIIQMIFRFWHVRSLEAFFSLPMGVILLGVLMIFVEPIVHAKIHHGGESVMDLLFQGFGASFDSVISLMSNTISFARLAGFALAHVALAEVVHALRETSAGLGIFGLIFMNVLALSIEFMVVIIQSLRLLYYEFSTKFYFGDGEPFKPFSIRARKS